MVDVLRTVKKHKRNGHSCHVLRSDNTGTLYGYVHPKDGIVDLEEVREEFGMNLIVKERLDDDGDGVEDWVRFISDKDTPKAVLEQCRALVEIIDDQ